MLRVIDDIHLSEIGNALRDTLGEGNQFPPKDMGDAVRVSNEVAFSDGYGSGFEEGEEFGYNTGFTDGDKLGYQAGMEQGYNSGKADGIEEGKKAQYDEFWDSYQTEGNRTNNDRAFQSLGWNDVTFKPKYDIKLTHATQCFMNSQFTDLKAILQRCGVSLITGGGGNYSQMFQGCLVTHIPEMDISKASNTTNMFNAAKSLVSIDKLIVDENTVLSIFTNTSSLKDISFEGVIGTDISFSSSPLSVGSLKNIIEHLKDFSGGNEYSQTVTFKTSSFNALEAEGATAEYNGVACTWAELIGYKKWNLVKA